MFKIFGTYILILAHSVYKMWIIREPNKIELWNKLHFKERKKRRVYTMFKIFGTYILILAHSVYKMRIIQEPNKLEFWNKLHFKKKKTESIHHV